MVQNSLYTNSITATLSVLPVCATRKLENETKLMQQKNSPQTPGTTVEVRRRVLHGKLNINV